MGIVFTGDSFSVRVLSRQVRSVQQEFEVAVRPQVALCIPITSDGLLVLISQYRPAVENVVLEFPAGRLAEGEDAEHAASRELLEETGFVANELHRIGALLTAPHFSDELVNVFVARGELVLPQSPTPKEDLREIVRMPPSAIAQAIASGRLVDSKSIAAHALACIHEKKSGVTL